MRCFVCHRAGAALYCGPVGHAHRPCFNAWDDGDQAAMFAAMATPPFEFDKGVEPGRRFGRLTVLGRVQRKPQHFEWRVACDCGATSIVQTYALRGGVSQCKTCSNRATAAARRKLPVSVVDFARRAGVAENTIRRRLERGWPLERLASPATQPGRAA